MTPVITFPDAQLATRNLLRSLLAGRTETYAQNVTVSTKVPEGKADEAPALPYIAVRTDGRFRDSRLNGRATVRVSVWHSDEGKGERLAALCEALLLSAYSAEIRSIGTVSGPIPTQDPDTGDPLSFFTVTARLVPEQLN